MPTLIETGHVKIHAWMNKTTKRMAQELTGAEFILKMISDRFVVDGNPPTRIIKSPGDHVIVIKSGTGSGKSTVLPVTLYNLIPNGNLACTQPTRATTMSIPFQITEYYPEWKMGENLGYQTGVIEWKPIRKGITFITNGILLQQLKIMTDEQFMRKYSIIAIDEVHVRSVELDMCLLYLRAFLSRNWQNPHCPTLLLMSATFSPQPLMQYFGCPKDAYIEVGGQSFPIKEHFMEVTPGDYQQYVVDQIEQIHVQNLDDVKPGNNLRDILVFASGTKEINEIVDKIHELNTTVLQSGIEFAKQHSATQMKKYQGAGSRGRLHYLMPLAITSEAISTRNADYNLLYTPLEKSKIPVWRFESGKKTATKLFDVECTRRVIVATNAIETGLTIDTLKYCIDTGYTKESTYDPNYSTPGLITKNVTQASAKQRKGRVGRKAPGLHWYAYTQATHAAMACNQLADILRIDCSDILLDLIIEQTGAKIDMKNMPDGNISDWGVSDINYKAATTDTEQHSISYTREFRIADIDFFEAPSIDSCRAAMEKLINAGCIDENYQPTWLGLHVSKHFRKLPIESIHQIMLGYTYGACIMDLITIAAWQALEMETGFSPKKHVWRNPLQLDADARAQYTNVIFGCEALEYLFIWDEITALMSKLSDSLNNTSDKKSRSFNYKALLDYVAALGLRITGIFRVIELRDEIIAGMIAGGLNPYWNSLGIPYWDYNLTAILNRNINEGIEQIIAIKRCIGQAWNANLLEWSQSNKSYMHYRFGVPVVVDSPLIRSLVNFWGDAANQTRARYIIAGGIRFRLAGGKYEFYGSAITVMDGIIQPDERDAFK